MSTKPFNQAWEEIFRTWSVMKKVSECMDIPNHLTYGNDIALIIDEKKELMEKLVI